jgi:hypothetical protein
MERNLELLKTTWNFIKNNPEKHQQSDFINHTQCGTQMCFAGHAAVISGAEFPRDDSPWFLTEDGRLSEKDKDGLRKGIYIEEYARNVLGMTNDESHFIFYYTSNNGFAGRIEHLIELWEKDQPFAYNFYDDSAEYDDEPCPCCDYDEDDCE